jgi:hypothetical protein
LLLRWFLAILSDMLVFLRENVRVSDPTCGYEHMVRGQAKH